LVAVFGAAGTVCRYWLDRLVLAHTRSSVPLGTALVNVTGSLLLGLLSGFVASGLLPEAVALAIGGGFVGGYTTFSTAMFETVMLLRTRRPIAGLCYGIVPLVLSIVAAAVGYCLSAGGA